MILITGASGNFGRAAVEALIKKGVDKRLIAGLVRDKEKGMGLRTLGVSVRIGDYNNYESLLEAFKGVDQLLLVSGTDILNREAQQQAVVNAAKATGVKHILYTSVDRKSDATDSPLNFILRSHLATENAIKESGMKYTILRNNLYLDTLPWFLGQHVLETGIYFPAGDGRIGFALRSEMAEAAAEIILSNENESHEYELSGCESVSFAQIAEMLTRITNKPVNYHNPEVNDYLDTLTKAGVPVQYQVAFSGFATAARNGELMAEHSVLERLLGRKPTTVDQYLAQVYGQGLQ